MIYEVLRIGVPSLREVSEPVPVEFIQTPTLQTMIDNLVETMRHLNGVGICAPQVGINKRVMIFEVNNNPRYPNAEPVPFTILINPSFEILSAEKVYAREGCLSMGGLRGIVPRYTHIRYRGLDRNGKLIEREVKDFHARVFQHEYDHIEGLLYIDRVEDTKTLGFTRELEAAGLM